MGEVWAWRFSHFWELVALTAQYGMPWWIVSGDVDLSEIDLRPGRIVAMSDARMLHG